MTADLQLVPISFADACEFIAMWHRHHEPPNGHRFSIGVAAILGVAKAVQQPAAQLNLFGEPA